MSIESCFEQIAIDALEKTAYNDELEKIALSPSLLMRAGTKAINKKRILNDAMARTFSLRTPTSLRGKATPLSYNLKQNQKEMMSRRGDLAKSVQQSKSELSKEPLRRAVRHNILLKRVDARNLVNRMGVIAKR